jgi:hypothetical protein
MTFQKNTFHTLSLYTESSLLQTMKNDKITLLQAPILGMLLYAPLLLSIVFNNAVNHKILLINYLRNIIFRISLLFY